MRQSAGIYLLQNHSTCFGCPSHPSSRVHKTVPEAAVTVLCTPDDRCDATRNMWSDFAVNKYLHTAAYC